MSKSKKALIQTKNAFLQVIPIILGTILLVGLFNNLITKQAITKIFSGHLGLDPIIGALIGSLAAGNPITSYIIGGELLKSGVSLAAVVAFLIAWVTVGVVQLPAESMILGKRFAWTRNIVSFISAIIIAVLTLLILKLV